MKAVRGSISCLRGRRVVQKSNSTMLDDTSADVEGGIEINLAPVGDMTDQDCEGIVLRTAETWWS